MPLRFPFAKHFLFAKIADNVSSSNNKSSSPNPYSSFSIFQVGKEGIGYILRGENLGEMNGQVFSTPVCDGGA